MWQPYQPPPMIAILRDMAYIFHCYENERTTFTAYAVLVHKLRHFDDIPLFDC